MLVYNRFEGEVNSPFDRRPLHAAAASSSGSVAGKRGFVAPVGGFFTHSPPAPAL